MNLNLQDKVALITGAASGLGRRSAEIFVEEGVGLVLADRNPHRLRETAEDLRRQGGRVLDLAIDVRDYHECVQAVDSGLEHFGRLDILVNSAGVADHGLFAETDPESWMRQIDTNLRGVMNCCRAVSRIFMEKRSGKIISLASEAGKVGEKRIAVYSATKGGVIAFTKALSIELGRFSINVNAVCPGVTKTAMTSYLTSDQEREWSRHYPLGRLGIPDDIAPLIVFLASDRASWITGQAISINGGFGRS